MPFSRKKPEIQVGLSGTALKYIAMATMLADHIGAVLLERIVYYRGNLEQVAMLMTSQWGDTLYWLWRMLRTVGGLHFPFTAFYWWRDSFIQGTGADTGSGWLRLRLSQKFLSAWLCGIRGPGEAATCTLSWQSGCWCSGA